MCDFITPLFIHSALLWSEFRKSPRIVTIHLSGLVRWNSGSNLDTDCSLSCLISSSSGEEFSL